MAEVRRICHQVYISTPPDSLICVLASLELRAWLLREVVTPLGEKSPREVRRTKRSRTPVKIFCCTTVPAHGSQEIFHACSYTQRVAERGKDDEAQPWSLHPRSKSSWLGSGQPRDNIQLPIFFLNAICILELKNP